MMKVLHRLIPSPPQAAAILSILIMSVALLLGPAIGMADNGDFYRITNGNGLYKLDREQTDQYFNYFSKEYGVYQYFNEYEKSNVSSQTIFIEAAKALDALFTADKAVFDIRFLSVIFILYGAAAIYMLVDYATFGVQGAARYAIAALAVFIFADTGYTAYFSSFYAEGLAMVSFLCSIGSMLLLSQKRYSPYALLAIFLVNSAILTFAKQQNAPVGLLAALLLIAMMWALIKEHAFEQTSNSGPAYIKRKIVYLRLSATAAVLLIASGVAVYVLIPQEFVNINEYHAMTRGVLMTSNEPEETLKGFGIDRQYALLNEQIYYERYPMVNADSETLETSFYSKYSVASIAMYYVSHPAKLGQMLDIAAKSAYTIRPASLGNFQRSAGRPAGAKTNFFTLYSTLKDAHAPRTIGFILIYTAMVIALSYKKKGRTMVFAFAILTGLLQILVSIVGAGDADLSKHVFLYNVSFDFIVFVGLSALIAMIGSKLRARRKTIHAKAKEKEMKLQAQSEAALKI